MLSLRTLGGTCLVGPDGRPIAGAAAQRRPLALLALLATADEAGLSRDRILGLLWPENEQEKARHALTQTLYHVRRAVKCDDLFIIAPAVLRLNTARITSDAAELTAAARRGDHIATVELYGGPFLEGFYISGSGEFEQWVALQRQRFADMAKQALTRLAVAAENRADWDAAAAWRMRLVALDPLAGAAVAKLMAAMALTGDRTGALRQAMVHATLVREQLEIEPDPVVIDLERKLRTSPPAAPERSFTEFAAPGPATPPAPAAVPATLRPTRSHSRRGRALFVGAAGLAAAIIIAVGVVLHRRDTLASARPSFGDGAQSVVVAPFRIAGVDPSLAYLKEGMVELLSTRLADAQQTRAVDPGAALSAWHKAGGSPEGELPRATAIRIARELDATLLVVGSVVGNAGRLTLAAQLVAPSSGGTRGEASVEGRADDLTALVDHLAAKLLAATAGERLSDRTTPSLPALRAFLDGQAAFRRGDYSTAAPRYERALGIDSSFALAALYLALAADRINDAEQHDRALAIAWANRADLSERDLVHLLAFAGPRYPAPSTEAEQLAAWQRATEVAGDRADVWYELGERFFRNGGVVGVRDAHARAVEALRRALELEPGHKNARALLIQIAARKLDTALLRQIASPRALRDSIGEPSAFLRWRVALVRRDEKELHRLRARFEQLDDATLRAIAMAVLYDGVALDDGERAARLSAARHVPQSRQLDVLLEQHALALNEGRPMLARAITDQIEDRLPGSRAHLRLRILDALYAEGDSVAAAAAANVLDRITSSPTPAGEYAEAVALADLCVVEQWRIAHGVTSQAPRTAARLSDTEVPHVAIPVTANPRTCAEIILTEWAVATHQYDAIRRVASLDSLMLNGPAVRDAGTYANIVVGRLYRQLDQPRAALDAYRRRAYMAGWPRYLATMRREEADLADQLGDTAIASASRARYLALRRSPEVKAMTAVTSGRRSGQGRRSSAVR